MGEVLALLRKSGIDGRAGFEVLTNSLFDGKVHKAYGGKIGGGVIPGAHSHNTFSALLSINPASHFSP